MTPFSLSPAQETLQAETRALARQRLLPLAAAHAAQLGQGGTARVDRPLLAALGESGIIQRIFPARAGGSAPGEAAALDLCLLREALAQECTEAETAFALQGLGAYPILQSGQPAVVTEWIPRVARGEAVAAFALSEPGAGSDAAAIETRAEPEGEGWRLTGQKTWISNAPEADVYTLFARTTQGAGARGVTAFVVRGGMPGLSGEPIDLLSPHAVGTLVLEGVRVGRADVLGEIDGGFRVAMKTLDLFRPSVGAFAVGMAQAALDAAVAHAATREQFGQPLFAFQAVAHALADAATRTEAARLLVYRAAALHDAGTGRTTGAAAMAKLFATETAQHVVDVALQVHGARGLVRGHLLEHLYREVRAPRIYEGTSEIERSLIARELQRAHSQS